MAGRRDGGTAGWLALVAILAVLLPVFPPSRLPAQSAQSPTLARRLDARLNAPPFNRFLWGVAVVDDRGRLLYGRNADRLFIPASTAKLFVSVVATALLPAEGTVPTSVYGTGAVVNGVLQGDLVLYGRGDPTMSRRCYGTDTTAALACDPDPAARFRRLAAGLAARGIRSVSGDLVGDGSWFEPTVVHPAWENYDLNWWYAAPVSGLGFNDNAVDITWGAGPAAGSPAKISFAPMLGDVALDNHTITISGDTGATIDFFRDPGTLRIRAEGRVPQGRSGRIEHFALPDANLYAAWAFGAALAEAGISVQGRTRSTTDSAAYQAARAERPLAEADSRPYRDWLFPILNSSQNWFAEMLLKQVGRERGRGGSWADGLAVERRFLIDSVRLDSTEFALVDGSGLAAENAVTPAALVRLLQFARRHPRMEPFLDALPRAGERGSLRRRFGGTPAAGRVQAKPGSIPRVNGLAGYLEPANGRRVTFAVLVNHHTLPNATMVAAIDTLVVEMARWASHAR